VIVCVFLPVVAKIKFLYRGLASLVKSGSYFTGACPVKFMLMRSVADLTGVAPRGKPGLKPADGTGAVTKKVR